MAHSAQSRQTASAAAIQPAARTGFRAAAPPNEKRGRLRARVFRVKREKGRNLSKIRVPRRYSSVHSSVSSATNHTGVSMAVTRLRGVMFPVKRHTKV